MPTDTPKLDVEVIGIESPLYGQDIEVLQARGLALPHQYGSWPRHDSQHGWRWCRVLDDSGTLVTGFAVELSHSRAVPGSFVGRLDRLGRTLHAPVAAAMGDLLAAAARSIPRLQRLDVQVFDEDAHRRHLFETAITAAGGQPVRPMQSYAWTVVLPLLDSEEAFLKSLNGKTRHRMRAFFRPMQAWTAAVEDPLYLPRIREIHAASYQRTGSHPPAINFEDLFADACDGASTLAGAFVADRVPPDDLVAFGWARLHGDHVVYETAGSERSDALRGLSPGDAVIWQISRWARDRSATWIDLGGVAEPGEPHAKNLQGIAAFKRRVGGPDVEVASEFRFIPHGALDKVARIVRNSLSWVGPRPGTAALSSRPPHQRATPGASTRDTPVLVLGSGLTALGVLRICHRAAIAAYSMGPAEGLERFSRWYRPAPVSAPAGEAKDLESFLRRCALPEAVLMPCSDAMVMQASRLPTDLAGRYRTSLSSPATMASLVDKAAFAQALQAVGAPHPRTILLDCPEDLRQVPDSALQDAFLKPHDSQRFHARFSAKAFRISSREDGMARMEQIQAAGLRVLLQEYIPGPGSLHYLLDGFVDRTGVVRGMLARRRLRMHPRDFGNSSYMVSVPMTEVGQAADSLSALLRHIGFRGIFSAEFKRDPRDGIFKMLEVNARPWWYIEFTERCGLDVCSMAYRDALGLDVDSVTGYRVGQKLVYAYYDYFACWDAYREGEISATAWARSWLGAQQALFNWTDPLPALVDAWSTAGRRTLRRLGLREGS